MRSTDTSFVFETDRLIVRHYTPEDSDDFFSLNGDEEVMRYIRPVKTREDTDSFLMEVISYAESNPGFGRMAVIEKTTGIFVGSFALIPVENNDNMQIGYAFLPEYWGNGYATEITRGGLGYIFTQTGLDSIYGYTEQPNMQSQKVLIKAGFIESGRKTEGEKELIEFKLVKDKYLSGFTASSRI